MDTTEMNLLGALQAVVPLLEGSGVAITGVGGVTWTLAHQGEELQGVVEGVGRRWWEWVPLRISGQYLRTSCGLTKRNKRKPAPCSPELLFWGSWIPGAPNEVFKMKRLLLATQRVAGLLSCTPSLPQLLHCFVKIEAGIFFFFFKVSGDKKHLHHKFKFTSNWKFVSICTVCQKKKTLFLYEYRMWFMQELTENN